MAIIHSAVVVGGIPVTGVYTRTKAVNVIKKDREGDAGIYCVCECETFKDEASAGGTALPLEGGNIHFKLTNLDSDPAYTGLTGTLAEDAFGVLYARAKEIIVERGWAASTDDIVDV